VNPTTLLNATSLCIHLEDDIVTCFHFSVSKRVVEQIGEAFVPMDLIQEGLIILRKVRVGGFIKEELDNTPRVTFCILLV
jgi:hypothetical protein